MSKTVITDFDKKLSERVSTLMDKEPKGIGRKLSKHLGVTAPTITAYRNATSKIPSEKVVQIAEFFNVSTDFLLKGSDSPFSRSEEHTGSDVLEAVNILLNCYAFSTLEGSKAKTLIAAQTYNKEQQYPSLLFDDINYYSLYLGDPVISRLIDAWNSYRNSAEKAPVEDDKEIKDILYYRTLDRLKETYDSIEYGHLYCSEDKPAFVFAMPLGAEQPVCIVPYGAREVFSEGANISHDFLPADFNYGHLRNAYFYPDSYWTLKDVDEEFPPDNDAEADAD